MARRRRQSEPSRAAGSRGEALRIIGGRMRGRKLEYSGDPRTRPMKDRVREAAFNLIGPRVKGKHAVDLFAGTGALGLEALSRGAARATFIERHFPTADVIRRNLATLEAEALGQVFAGDTFHWARTEPDLGETPWLVFCSPPYDLYQQRGADLLALLAGLIERAPPGSLFVVEADKRFDYGLLPQAERWDVRPYPPAVLGLLEIGGGGK